MCVINMWDILAIIVLLQVQVGNPEFPGLQSIKFMLLLKKTTTNSLYWRFVKMEDELSRNCVLTVSSN